MLNTNQPKIGFNLPPDIFLETNIPIKIPAIENKETRIKNPQSIPVDGFSPKNPINDFAAIITKDVPIAFLIFNLDNKTKAGINRLINHCHDTHHA